MVIVIIGVLASLVIVSYRGIQQKANTTKTAAAVQAYRKALLQYAGEKSSYPSAGGGHCLGEGYPNGKCYNNFFNENPAFNTLLRPYMGSLMPLPGTTSANPVDTFHGVMFLADPIQTIDGQPSTYFIWYVVEGAGTKCPVGPIVGGDYPTYTSNPASGYSIASTNGSRCWLPLPNPATL